jgi:hypothetical protein
MVFWWKKALLAAGAAGFGLVGCSTAPPQFNYEPAQENISIPAPGEVRTARAGDEILRSGRFVARDTIFVPAALQVSAYRISPGSFKKVGRGPEGDFFLPAGGPDTGAFAPIGGLVDPPQALLVTSKAGALCVVTVYYISACDRPTAAVTFASAEGFERRTVREPVSGIALLYAGTRDNMMRLAFRELADPAAQTVPLEFNLASSRVISVRGSSLEVLEAGADSMRYRVLP